MICGRLGIAGLKEALNDLRSTSIHQSTHSGDALVHRTDQIPQSLSRLTAESFA
jgi:hypothetical protein